MPHAGLMQACGWWPMRVGGGGGSAHIQTIVAMVVIGEVAHACGQRCFGVQWPELMVEVDCGGWNR
jgi:hypothetical protein